MQDCPICHAALTSEGRCRMLDASQRELHQVNALESIAASLLTISTEMTRPAPVDYAKDAQPQRPREEQRL